MELFESGSAVISDCGKYRYELTRKISDKQKNCLFIMLNPSTADASEDDPTIRRCISYAKDWDCGELIVVNLFAYRATDPSELRSRMTKDPVGPDNKEHIIKAVDRVTSVYEAFGEEPGPVVCAWGTNGDYMGQNQTLLGWLDGHPATAMCLQKTKHGHPSHPLYLKKGLKPIPLEKTA